jgi:hypothetical protein
MLQPARTKYRKAFKGKIHGVATRGAELNFGSFGLKATEPNRVTSKEIEAARVALTRHMKRAGRVWLRIFPNIPVIIIIIIIFISLLGSFKFNVYNILLVCFLYLFYCFFMYNFLLERYRVIER